MRILANKNQRMKNTYSRLKTHILEAIGAFSPSKAHGPDLIQTVIRQQLFTLKHCTCQTWIRRYNLATKAHDELAGLSDEAEKFIWTNCPCPEKKGQE